VPPLSGERPLELPSKLERCLAALSKLYAQDHERELQQIIVNAQNRLVEEPNDFDRRRYTLYLVLPETLFGPAAKNRDQIQGRICSDLNTIHGIQDEYFDGVFLEMEVPDGDWRQQSGLLITPSQTVAPDDATRIWGDSGYRLFLGHKAEVKQQVGTLKRALKMFGVSAFVAHEDIHPTREWQDEIQNALRSMDAFVALMTDGFHDSNWTDQEVGFALARGVPVIAVRLGRDPYGFIGKFQALSATWDDAAVGIVKLLMKHDRMVAAYVQALRDCPSFDDGNKLALALPAIERATDSQIDELVAAANEDSQLHNSYGFNGKNPAYYGTGIIPHLHRLGTRRFTRDKNGLIVPATAPTANVALQTVDDDDVF
jgi:hypothetical protein